MKKQMQENDRILYLNLDENISPPEQLIIQMKFLPFLLILLNEILLSLKKWK